MQVRVDPNTLDEVFAASVPLARPGRCQAPLRNLAEERIRSVLDGAAQFRLKRKATHLQRTAESHGRDEALFQGLATALGYKQNKLPFALLAQRLSLEFLREKSEDAEALLFGLAGFLSAPDLGVYDERDARLCPNFVGSMVASSERNGTPRLAAENVAAWRSASAQSPAAPAGCARDMVRQVACLHQIVRQSRPMDQPRESFSSIWSIHSGIFTTRFSRKRRPKEMALIGDARIADILANVLFPFFSAEGRDAWREFAKLPAKLSNRRLETAATRLFGDDPRRPLFMKTVAQQQGLLQIYEDFCLQDNSDCAQCPFPEQMHKWR